MGKQFNFTILYIQSVLIAVKLQAPEVSPYLRPKAKAARKQLPVASYLQSSKVFLRHIIISGRVQCNNLLQGLLMYLHVYPAC